MRNLTLSLGRLAVVLAGALSLGACSRSEYAFLPPSASYLGSTPVARPRAVAALATASAPAQSAVVTAPAAPGVASDAVAAQPAPVALAPAPAAVAPLAAVATKPAVAPKPNLVQRLALRKLTKKLDKLASQAPQFKKHDATASTARIEGNLRSAILFGLLSLIAYLLPGGFFSVVGTILLIVAIVFLVLWVLDQA